MRLTSAQTRDPKARLARLPKATDAAKANRVKNAAATAMAATVERGANGVSEASALTVRKWKPPASPTLAARQLRAHRHQKAHGANPCLQLAVQNQRQHHRLRLQPPRLPAALHRRACLR